MIQLYSTYSREHAYQLCSYALQHDGIPYLFPLHAQGSTRTDDADHDRKLGRVVATAEEHNLADVMTVQELSQYNLQRALHHVEGRFRRAVSLGVV